MNPEKISTWHMVVVKTIRLHCGLNLTLLTNYACIHCELQNKETCLPS